MADLRRRGKALEDEEFQERDVWEWEFSSKGKIGNQHSSTSSAWSLSSSSSSPQPRLIPKRNNGSRGDGFSGGAGGGTGCQSSAPVAIPDWSKITKREHENYECDSDDDTSKRMLGKVDGFDDDGGGEMVPPHEYLARRLAGTQIASFSMLEGVGRTLKGRDLSKLRNDILTKTGFLE